MRILHLITRMDRGGSAVNTLICATEQVQAGHHVVLAMGMSEESSMSPDEAHRVEEGLGAFQVMGGVVRRLPPLKRSLGLHDWSAYSDIAMLIGNGFDIVHTHTSKAGALGRLAVAGRAKVVHTPHGHIFDGYFGPLKTKLFIAAEKWLAKKCDTLIALTHAEMEDHLKLGIGSPEQWHVVPSGVEVGRIAGQVDRMRRESGDERCWQAASVGRLVPVKGMDRLVRGWEAVCQRVPGAQLAIVGDGPEREFLEALAAELGVAGNIHFAGWADPLPYLAGAESFVLLSRNEGMGRAVVEAMAASLPCVVSDVCGLRELVGGTIDRAVDGDIGDPVGRIVDGDASEEVAEAVLGDWQPGMGEAARARAGNYSVEAMIDALETIYDRLCNPAAG